MPARFNPPPNWPTPPAGWTPPPGWQPDAAWGPAPDGWQFWVDDSAQTAVFAFPPPVPVPGAPQNPWYRRWWAIAAAAVLGLTVVAGIIGAAQKDRPVSAASGVTEAQEESVREQSAAPTTRESAAPSSTTSTPPPPPPPPTTPPPPPPPPAPVLSAGQENALRSAGQYLDYTSFSRTGLISQLEYEGYSTADATWAVDNLGVDWNQQAALKAAEYLDYTAFSRQGLVDQLIYEGFTAAEAEYGASQAYDG
ncbi:Ltp family lipoprotein [Blastococcus sp. PRF04-17]|uniref:Ltp family lipoprotein n=1 Tax=Blastococcus sp. PRF04-17 TaxID=2933797 RepID=UPI001FF5D67E|nr:Ltp family lipoprotein [Blastococcus sp. PRF04-17]UOY01842.1 Ltp family lipoprotein [Blastococcus sp. PRF04-17]